MADNVTIPTQGTGDSTPVVATDDVSGAHYQKVKLVDGTADSSTAIPGSGDGLHIKTHSTIVDLTLSLDTGIYADGDVLAAAQELASAVRSNGATGVLQSIYVIDKDDQGMAFDIVVADQTIALGTENSPVSISDADAAKILGIISISSGDYVDLVNSQAVTMSGLGLVLKPSGASTSVYIGAISRGTGTYTASGIVLRFGIVQD